MKRISLLFYILLYACLIHAENVPVDKALRVATNYYKQSTDNVSLRSASLNPLSLIYKAESSSMLRSALEGTEYYVFNVENEGGFIIVSGDDCAYPILGYSFEGSFDPDNIPPAMKEWLQMYQDEIAYAVKENIGLPVPDEWQSLDDGSQTQNVTTRKRVAPLCNALWGQGAPYNLQCPTINSALGLVKRKTITGCIATAMAIVMKYHEYPRRGTGSHTHTDNNKWVANFGNTTYLWDKMPLTTREFNTDEKKNAVAELMYHCGVSIDINYGSATGGNIAYIPYALSSYFGYDKQIEAKTKTSHSDSEWKDMIKKELDENRPIIYRGAGSSGGHAFVCDGYDDNYDAFHFNWGWEGNSNNSGSFNGYFRLNTLVPYTTYDYSNEHVMIIGIQPAKTNENYSTLRISDLLGGKGMSKANVNIVEGQSFAVILESIYNPGNTQFKGTIAVALMDSKGIIKEIMGKINTELSPNYFLGDDGITDFDCKITTPISNTDILRVVTSATGKEPWQIVYGGVGITDFLRVSNIDVPTVTTGNYSDLSYTTATIHGKVISDGNAAITEKGFYYTKDPNFTSSIIKVTRNNVNDDFLSLLTGLEKGIKYYYKAYAINSVGTGEGEIKSFTTLDEKGLTEAINELIPKDIQKKITDLGMPIYGGGNPPNINGTYKFAPVIMKATSIKNDFPLRHRFDDITLTFSNQDNNNLTIEFSYTALNEFGEGTGAYIVGENNKFSVFVEVNGTESGQRYKSADIIAGTVTPTGIKDLYYSFFILDDYGDPHNKIVGIGQGRVVYDSDGFSEKTDSRTMSMEQGQGFGSVMSQRNTTDSFPVIEEDVYINYSDGSLFVDSPLSEKISIYSINGSFLHSIQKSIGKTIFDVGALPKGIIIINGESGWTRKIIIQ